MEKAGMSSTDIEKKSLEAHVELCAERYSNLENKLNNLDGRMDKLEEHIVDIKDSLGRVGNEGNKTLITIGTAIFVALLTAVLGVVVHLATK
jgi:prefoldin subunit 5